MTVASTTSESGGQNNETFSERYSENPPTLWSMIRPSWEHPFRSWIVLLIAIFPVVFLIVQADSYFGFHWLTTGKGGLRNHAILALLITVLFVLNPFILLFVLPVVFAVVFLATIPIVVVSEGLKLGMERKNYRRNEGSRRLIIDGIVRVGSLAALLVSSILFPQAALLLLVAFPYNFVLFFGVSIWIGETVALVLFVYRSRKVAKETEILLAT